LWVSTQRAGGRERFAAKSFVFEQKFSNEPQQTKVLLLQVDDLVNERQLRVGQ